MKIERFAVKTCCGMMGVALKLSVVLSRDFLPLLVEKGFTEGKTLTKAGIFYVENKELIATGAFNSNILQIKCKVSNCTSSINIFEQILVTMG
jgi:hypothetical protein